MFGSFGGSEILILAVLFLVIFGPAKLPQMAKDIGRFIGEARRAVDEFKDELSAEIDPEDPPKSRKANGSGSTEGLEHNNGSSSAPAETAPPEGQVSEPGFRDL